MDLPGVQIHNDTNAVPLHHQVLADLIADLQELCNDHLVVRTCSVRQVAQMYNDHQEVLIFVNHLVVQMSRDHQEVQMSRDQMEVLMHNDHQEIPPGDHLAALIPEDINSQRRVV
jgi:hypothetical protein